MMGCCVAWKWAVACLFLELSQQPTCPHVRQSLDEPSLNRSSHILHNFLYFPSWIDLQFLGACTLEFAHRVCYHYSYLISIEPIIKLGSIYDNYDNLEASTF